MFTGPASGIAGPHAEDHPDRAGQPAAAARRWCDAVARRLRAGQTVVAFPEGTTWCGLAYGLFRPGDVPGRDRRRPAGAAAAADLPPRRRQPYRPCRPTSATTRLLRSICRLLYGAPHAWRACRSSPCSCRGPTGAPWPGRCQSAVRRGSPRRAGRRARAGGLSGLAVPAGRYRGARHGLPGSRRHHPDAPRCRRGDDGCARHGRQRLVAAHQRPGGAAAHRGIP